MLLGPASPRVSAYGREVLAGRAGHKYVGYVGCEGEGLSDDSSIIIDEFIDVFVVSVVRVSLTEPFAIQVPLVLGSHISPTSGSFSAAMYVDCWLAAYGFSDEVMGTEASVEEWDESVCVGEVTGFALARTAYGWPGQGAGRYWGRPPHG